MKLMPWRERAPTATLHSDFEDWMKQFFDGDGMNRLPKVFQRGLVPAINLADDKDAFIATVELPGLKSDDIEIQMVGDQLVISGERKWEEEKKEKEYYRVESQYGSFRRAVELPAGLNKDPDAIVASYEGGMLEIRIPKVEPKPAARIEVKTK
jgi:HSP20 family protein